MPAVHYGLLATHFKQKHQALAKLQKEVAEIQKKETELKENLLAAAPPKMGEFLVDNLLLDKFFDQSYICLTINYTNFEEYGFVDALSIKTAFKALKKAWADCIELKFKEEPREGRISVRITIDFFL